MTVAAAAGVHGAGIARAQPIEPALERASQAFDTAQYEKDRDTLQAMLAPAMVFINGAGTMGGAGDFIAAFSDPQLKFEPFVIADRKWVRLGRDVATVTAVGTMAGIDSSGHFSRHFRFSDTFARRNGQWRVVFVQVTRLPPPA